MLLKQSRYTFRNAHYSRLRHKSNDPPLSRLLQRQTKRRINLAPGALTLLVALAMATQLMARPNHPQPNLTLSAPTPVMHAA